MRLFVAVDLSREAVDEAVRVGDEIRSRAPRASLRWVPAPNMHLTVRFVGHVSGDPDPLVSALAAPVPAAPFDITLGACGAFPSSGAIRVVWVGLTEGAAQLTKLSAHMDDRLRPFGFEPEARAYSPHLTLARAERDRRVPKDVREVLSHVHVRAVVTPVAHAVIYQSHLSPRGPRYEPLASIPLTGPAAELS